VQTQNWTVETTQGDEYRVVIDATGVAVSMTGIEGRRHRAVCDPEAFEETFGAALAAIFPPAALEAMRAAAAEAHAAAQERDDRIP
jgi:hypothetical protein